MNKKLWDKPKDVALKEIKDKAKEIAEQDLQQELNRRTKHPPITILGEKLTPEEFPKLYEWAKTNPETLEANIKGMMEKQGFTNPGSAMAILESDLK